jgi:hypothetical protein
MARPMEIHVRQQELGLLSNTKVNAGTINSKGDIMLPLELVKLLVKLTALVERRRYHSLR